jgi:hypothetical protein
LTVSPHKTGHLQGKKWALPLALFVLLILLNGLLVSPFIGWYDSGEMIAATLGLGISHPPGQALYHLLGKLFLLLAPGTPAFGLGLFSAACSASAAALFLALGFKLERSYDREPGKAQSAVAKWLFLLALAWSLSLPWWKYSVLAEVYSLHLLLGLLVLWVLSLDKPSKWPLAFFALGMGTVFRPTHLFAVPLVVLAFFMERKGYVQREGAKTPRRGRGSGKSPAPPLNTILFLGTVFVLGRSLLLYLPLRSILQPDVAYAPLTHPAALLKHLFVLKASAFVGAASAAGSWEVLLAMLSRFWTDLTPLGAALAVGGGALWVRSGTKAPAFLWVGLSWGLLEALLVLTIPYPTFEPHQTLLLWAFSGFLAVPALCALGRWARRARSHRVLVTLLMGAFVLAQSSQLGKLLERKGERGAQDYARNLLSIMEPNALYFPAEENEYFPLVGYQKSFRFKENIGLLAPGGDPQTAALRIRESLAQGRPLYVTRKWALPPGWGYQEWGPLLRVAARPQAPKGRKEKLPERAVSWKGVELVAAIVSPVEAAAGEYVELRYSWIRTSSDQAVDSSTVLALWVDGEGRYLAKNGSAWFHDIHPVPAGFFAAMEPGLVYEEKRILFIPSDFPPGRYHLAVGLQKGAPARREGRNSFEREFDERSASQNLDKFLGRGEDGALVHFAAVTTGTPGERIWPVVKSRRPSGDPRFAVVAELLITSSE